MKNRILNFVKINKKTGERKDGGYMKLIVNDDNRAELYFYGDIVSSKDWKWSQDDRAPSDVAEFFRDLEGSEIVDVYINSGGGDVFAGIAIANILERYEGQKIAHVDGIAASIASVIMCACDKIVFATGAQCMIHKPWTYAYGNADDLASTIETLNMCEDSIIDVYMKHAKEGVTREMLAEKMKEETWFDADTITDIFDVEKEEKARAAACVQSEYYARYAHTPDIIAAAEPINKDADNDAATQEAEEAAILEELELI